MDVIVRDETTSERRPVEEMTRDAFWNLYQPGADEHFLIHRIRPLAILSLVAEVKGELVGHALVSPARIVMPDGSELKIASVGPICVRPGYQGLGVGSKLMRETIERTRQLGVPALAVMGYPFYYGRFGFKNGHEFSVSMPDGSQPWGFQLLPLSGCDALSGAKGGHFFESEGFEATPTDVAEFDKQFPPREIFQTRSARAFQTAIQISAGDPVPENVIKYAFCREPLPDENRSERTRTVVSQRLTQAVVVLLAGLVAWRIVRRVN